MSPRRIQAALVAMLIVSVAAGAAGIGASPPGQLATVDRVVDGDTLRTRGGARVRLLQIDAPESGEECFAGAATHALVRLAPPGTRVVLETDPALDRRDRYGRLLRYVHVGGVNVNVELVRRGAATPYFYDGDRGRYAQRFLDAVTTARRERRGMWGACRVLWTPEQPVTTR